MTGNLFSPSIGFSILSSWVGAYELSSLSRAKIKKLEILRISSYRTYSFTLVSSRNMSRSPVGHICSESLKLILSFYCSKILMNSCGICS